MPHVSGDPNHTDHEWTNILLREIADEIEKGFVLVAGALRHRSCPCQVKAAENSHYPSYYPTSPTIAPVPIARPTYIVSA